MINSFQSFILTCAFLIGSTGCITKYAVVMVEAKSINTNSPLSINVYSGKDCQYIGNGPPLLYLLEKKCVSKNETICLIVESKCYKTAWQIIQVTKWTKIQDQAYDADKVNKILFEMLPVKGCTENH